MFNHYEYCQITCVHLIELDIKVNCLLAWITCAPCLFFTSVCWKKCSKATYQASSPWKPDLSPDVEKCNFFFNPFWRRTEINTASPGFLSLECSLCKKQSLTFQSLSQRWLVISVALDITSKLLCLLLKFLYWLYSLIQEVATDVFMCTVQDWLCSLCLPCLQGFIFSVFRSSFLLCSCKKFLAKAYRICNLFNLLPFEKLLFSVSNVRCTCRSAAGVWTACDAELKLCCSLVGWSCVGMVPVGYL